MSQQQCERCKGVGLIKNEKRCCGGKCMKCEDTRSHGNYDECSKCAGIGVIYYDKMGRLQLRANFL